MNRTCTGIEPRLEVVAAHPLTAAQLIEMLVKHCHQTESSLIFAVQHSKHFIEITQQLIGLPGHAVTIAAAVARQDKARRLDAHATCPMLRV